MGITVPAWNTEGAVYSAAQGRRTEDGGERRNVFGGSLTLADDPIAQRRKQAQEQAWNVVKNAWETDRATDASIQSRRDHYAEMKRLGEEAAAQLKDITEDESVLQTLYGVEDDSREQKDLELLKREKDAAEGKDVSFTDGERERLAQLHSQPLTEYQERALGMYDQETYWRKQLADAERRMVNDTANIHAIERQRPEYQPMIEAQEAAEEIQKNANEEIKSMLLDEAVDHIDEQLEEAEEKQKESAEKKEEREEQIEEQKLQRAIREALIEGTKEAAEEAKREIRRSDTPDIETDDMVELVRGSDTVKDVGQSLDDIRSSMRVLEADLKGIKVDEEV